MKTIFLFVIAGLFFAGCGPKELTREQAFQILKTDYPYPQIYDYEVFCSDPEHAIKAVDIGLESNGLVTVTKTQTLSEIGKPLIHFSDKAKPYLLPVSEEDKAIDVQKVKIADQDLVEISGIKLEHDGKSALVEYKIAYKNLTPFSSLVEHDLKQPVTRKAYLSLYDDGWRMEKRK